MTRQTISGLTGLTPEQFGNKVANAVTGSEARTIAQEEIENSATVQSAVNSAVSGIDFVAASQAQQRGSLRFNEHNGKFANGKNSAFQQPKTNVPNLCIRGDSLLIRGSINYHSTIGNVSQTLLASGSGTLGNTMKLSFASHGYVPSAAHAGRLRARINFGSPGAAELVTSPIPDGCPSDVLIAIVTDNDGNLYLKLFSALDGTKLAEGAATTTATAGVPYRGAGFAVSSGVDSSGNFLTDLSAALTEPDRGWCGSVAEISIVRELYDDAALAQIAMFGNTSQVADIASVLYHRDFSRSDFKSAYMVSDNSSDIVALGESFIESGSTIGHVGAFTVEKKPVGFIAGIEPGQNSALLDLKMITDGTAEGEVIYRVWSGNTAVTGWQQSQSITAGATEHTIRLNIPVTLQWARIEIKFAGSTFYYNDPIAAGLKAIIHGQSQVAIMQSYDAAAGVVRKEKYPASYATEDVDEGWPYVYMARIDDAPISDGITGFVHQCHQHVAMPVCVMCNDVPGTGVEELCTDALTDREWAWTQYLADAAGGDVSCHIFQWGTNNVGTQINYGTQILSPLVEGIPSDNGGSQELGIPVIDHYLYDGQTFRSSAVFAISPLTGHRLTSAGPADTDGAYSGNAGEVRQSQIDWAVARDIPVGPFISDLPCVDGPHQVTDTPRANWRFGIRLGECALRALKLSHRKNPSVKSADWVDDSRNQIDVVFNLPNRGALRTEGGDPVWNFEYDDGAGKTRLGFTAQIVNPMTVRLTKDVGEWTDNVMLYFQHSGPFGYGTSIPQIDMITGQLYDGVGMDGTTPGDSLGTPVAGQLQGFAVG